MVGTKERLELFKKIAEEAIEKYPAEGDVTKCNLGLHYICKKLGYTGFAGLLANDIVRKIRVDPDFAAVDEKVAQNLANEGRLVVAGILGEGHGHVAACYQGKLTLSRKWGVEAPTVCNIGKTNGIMSANYAFLDRPGYWAWIEPKTA